MMVTGRLRALGVLARALAGPARRVSRLVLRVRAVDVDLNLHLTNSRYPQWMDLGRLDLLVRSGVARAMFAARQNPVVVETQIRFLRELPWGAEVVLDTRLVAVERRAVVFRQRFLVGEREHAVATVKVVVLGKGRVVVPDVMRPLLDDQVQASAERADQ